MKRWMHNLFMNDVRSAIDSHNMIDAGDRVLVGVSGGKDSSILLYALTLLSRYKIYDFEVMGLTVDHGLIGGIEPYRAFCNQTGLNLEVHCEHYAIDLSVGSEYAPCYTCSRLRKGILKRVAMEKGFNKIAIGHTKEDYVETFLMNIIQHGKLDSLKPKSEIQEGLALIRPLLLVDEKAIIQASKALRFPLMQDECRYAQGRLRSRSEDMLKAMETYVPEFSDKLIQAMGVKF